ncbi:hypothetical protein P4O66_001823 [Electrophorus voltai]|uniref:Uncharacterized protein n=1 Tax=Electrophorus voltai TaxID=2609070 RepID=A0AAD9DR44_9TELE|nr:hypothetical protein P4O66_001823 [Electrophorus voltai]
MGPAFESWFLSRANRFVDVVNLALHLMLQLFNSPGTYARVLVVDFSSAFSTIVPKMLQVDCGFPRKQETAD